MITIDLARLDADLGFVLGYAPDQRNQANLYIQALTHSSFTNEQKGNASHNERLEFLGDSVLGFCITEYLYRNFPKSDEGRLSKLKSYIVSAEALAKAARAYDLGHFVLLGKGESQDNGQDKDSILANVVEALIGACYLNQGLDRARELVILFMNTQLKHYHDKEYLPQDHKLQLQEYVQKCYKVLPLYRTDKLFINDKKSSHSSSFEAKLYINEQFICSGSGTSKKRAEKDAAGQALKLIAENEKQPQKLTIQTKKEN